MKMRWLCLLLAVIGDITVGTLPPPERSYKILMLTPVSCKSHRNLFMSLAEALAARGHEVVVLSNQKGPSKSDNPLEVTHGLPDFDCDSFNIFQDRRKKRGGSARFQELLPRIAGKIYKVPLVKDLYQRRMEFDLFIINHLFNEMTLPFTLGHPFITIAMCIDPRQSAVLGNVLNPSYVPVISGNWDMSGVLGRLQNVFQQIQSAVSWRMLTVVPSVQREITAQFPDLPPLLDIERNQSLTLMNSHFALDMTLPLLPSQVEVGGLHCRPAKPLPEDIEDWIEGAGSAGVIYFSIGSVARGDTIPVEYRDQFIEAFRRLKQRVIWKFESELEGLPDNVMIRKWLPQQDVIGHPNVKVFMTHGGILSTQEASFHSIPLLVLPTFADQFKNANKIVGRGLGLSLSWQELTVERIVTSLQELLQNTKYKENMSEVSKIFQDQMNHPMDRAIYWTEYVIRHQGAPMLRSPAAELSWVEFLLLDLIAIILMAIVVVVFILRWILRWIWGIVFGRVKGKSKKD